MEVILFKVELKIDGEYFKTLAFAKPINIKDIISSKDFSEKRIITYKINWGYVSSNLQIDKDVKLDCVSTDSTEGQLIYQDTSIFILCKAFYNLFSKDNKLVIEHSIGDGVYGEIIGYTFTEKDVTKLRNETQNIVHQALPIVKINMTPVEAEKIALSQNRDDVVRNLKFKKINLYKCGEYYDYFLRQLADNTGIIKSFEIVYHSPGVILRFPRKGEKEIKKKFRLPRTLFATHQEHDKWLNILQLHNVNALNRAIKNYEITYLIQIEEALHEKKIIDIANQITWKKDIKLVMVAGPSSSGKTTFAKRLSIQLRVNGVFPRILNMDNYFLPWKETPKKENGELDFETINALDLELLNKDLKNLLTGKKIEIPKYNFLKGVREQSYETLQLKENEILIMEGIHGLNDKLTSSVPFNQKLKIYVSALNNLNIDAHNRIPTTDSREIRRMIRDHNYRGHTAEETLEMWDSVREGEDKNIFPFQENADIMFNSILTYELGILKKYVMPLLQSVSNYCPEYMEAERLMNLMDHVYNIQDDLVPSNSILREFIGGSIYQY